MLDPDISTALLHLDYGDDGHSYVLYHVKPADLDAAVDIIKKAWGDYEISGRQGLLDDMIEPALRKAGIQFQCGEYTPIRIIP